MQNFMESTLWNEMEILSGRLHRNVVLLGACIQADRVDVKKNAKNRKRLGACPHHMKAGAVGIVVARFLIVLPSTYHYQNCMSENLIERIQCSAPERPMGI